jgi:hypothetical protein
VFEVFFGGARGGGKTDGMLGWQVIAEPHRNPWTGETVARERIYIPSRVTDNRYLGADYVANLQMSGNERLVRAWLEGDWSVIDGAFFPEWSTARHVLRCQGHKDRRSLAKPSGKDNRDF